MIVGRIVILLIIIAGLGTLAFYNKFGGIYMMLKLLYIFLIGIFLAVFVGVGIAAFYPEAKYPEPPVILKYNTAEAIKDEAQFAEFKAEAEKFDKVEKEYQANSRIYNRNVSVLALGAAIIMVAASLTFFKSILLIADGVLLGGVFTLVYSVIRGFGTDDNMFRFIVVSVGLFISLFLGYVKFIKPSKQVSR